MKPKHILIALLLQIAAMALVVAVTWPWVMHFDGELIRHWDPPFHAWKLELMAHRILSGDPFFLNRETTILYPHAGTLYFEALQWPASLFAALLFAATSWSPEFVYQATMLVFWAFSAPCMFLFLRCLKLSGAVSAAAALAFCVLPYRISYVNEFQMQFAFGTPLFFVAVLHFMNRPCVGRGALVAASMWLYAVTELNQAVFILFALPFVAASFLVANPTLVRSRGFLRGIAGAGVTGVLLIPMLLLPYAVQHSGGAVVRGLAEVDRHSVQVFSFLRPFGQFRLWNFNAKVEEWQAYPTLAVGVLALVFAGAMSLSSLRDTGSPLWRRLAPLPALISTAAFLALSAIFQCGMGTGRPLLVSAWSWLPAACAPCAFAASFSAGGDEPRRRMAWAFFGAAFFLAFLTVGPLLAINLNRNIFAAENVLYLALYKYGPFLKGFRAACRFGVIVHFFMLVAAAFALDAIVRRIRRTPLRVALCAAFLAAVATESIPQRNLLRSMPVDKPDNLPVMRRLLNCASPFTLAVLPMGNRTYDGMTMFTILKDRFNAFYAWCGYVPPATEAVCDAVRFGDYRSACAELATLWPECLILIDRSKTTDASRAYAESLPSHVFSHAGRTIVDYQAALSGEADVIESDERFTLLALRPTRPAERFTKKFRTDFATRLPVSRFSLSPGARVLTVSLNGHALDGVHASGEGAFSVALPHRFLARTGCNELEIVLDKEASLTSFCLDTAEKKGGQ